MLMCFAMQWSTVPCSFLLRTSCACWQALALAHGVGTPPPRQQQGEVAVMGDDMGGALHTSCPTGDSLSVDACVSGITSIWLKARVRVGKKLAAKGWLALGVKGSSMDPARRISLSVSTSLSTCRCVPAVPATTLPSVILVSLWKRPLTFSILRRETLQTLDWLANAVLYAKKDGTEKQFLRALGYVCFSL